MSEFPDADAEVGYKEFRYTLQELQVLRQCMQSNSNSIVSGVKVFLYVINYRGDSIPWQWFEFAEKIKDDPAFPESHFAPREPTCRVCVTHR